MRPLFVVQEGIQYSVLCVVSYNICSSMLCRYTLSGCALLIAAKGFTEDVTPSAVVRSLCRGEKAVGRMRVGPLIMESSLCPCWLVG